MELELYWIYACLQKTQMQEELVAVGDKGKIETSVPSTNQEKHPRILELE